MPSMIAMVALTLAVANSAHLPEIFSPIVIEPFGQASVFSEALCIEHGGLADQCAPLHNKYTYKGAKKSKSQSAPPFQTSPFSPKKADTCKKRHAECMQSESP